MEYLPCYNWQEVSDGLELLSAVGKTSLLNTGTLTMTEKLRLVMFTSQNGVLCYATSKVIQTGDGSTVLEPPSLSQSREVWPTNRRPRIRPPRRQPTRWGPCSIIWRRKAPPSTWRRPRQRPRRRPSPQGGRNHQELGSG